MFKLVVILLLILVVASLFSGLGFLVRDPARSARAVRALTVRIALSLLVFAVVVGGYYLGFVHGN